MAERPRDAGGGRCDGSDPDHARTGQVVVGGLGVLAVVAFVSTANQIHGRVHLTARGLEFRTWVSRRVVPWNEVVGIETRERVTRSGIWSELRVVRVRGRTLTLPGTATNRLLDAELDRKLVAVRACWSRAVGG